MAVGGTRDISVFGMNVGPFDIRAPEDPRGHRSDTGSRVGTSPTQTFKEHLDEITLHQEGDAWVPGANRPGPNALSKTEPFAYDALGKVQDSSVLRGRIIDIFI